MDMQWAGPHLLPSACPQETIKTKHPQLLYESKLYKILQGGGEHLPACCGCSTQQLDRMYAC